MSNTQLLSVLILLLAGCSKTSKVNYSWDTTPTAAAKSESAIDIFRNYDEFSERPTRPFREAGKLTAQETTGKGAGRAISSVIGLMRREAASKGCDALMIGAAMQIPATYNPAGTGNEYQTLWMVVGTCLFYDDAATTAPAETAAPMAAPEGAAPVAP